MIHVIEKAKNAGWLSGRQLVVLKPMMEMAENVQESNSNFLYANGDISVIQLLGNFRKIPFVISAVKRPASAHNRKQRGEGRGSRGSYESSPNLTNLKSSRGKFRGLSKLSLRRQFPFGVSKFGKTFKTASATAFPRYQLPASVGWVSSD